MALFQGLCVCLWGVRGGRSKFNFNFRFNMHAATEPRSQSPCSARVLPAHHSPARRRRACSNFNLRLRRAPPPLPPPPPRTMCSRSAACTLPWRKQAPATVLRQEAAGGADPVYVRTGHNGATDRDLLHKVFDVDVLRSIVHEVSGGSASDAGPAIAAAQLMRALRITLGDNAWDILPQLLKKRLADSLGTGKLAAPRSGERCSCSRSTTGHDGFCHNAAAIRRPGARAASTQPVLPAAGDVLTQQSAAVPRSMASAAAAEAGSSSAPRGPVAVARDGLPEAEAVNGDALAARMADAVARRTERAAAAAQRVEQAVRGGSDAAALPVSAEQAGAAAAAAAPAAAAAESAQQEARSGGVAATLTAEQAATAAAAAAEAEDQDPSQGTAGGQGNRVRRAPKPRQAYTPPTFFSCAMHPMFLTPVK
ncbi:hypothetical protein JKP88DRAFT_262579 [Tribonema minus]|uniref:Uncharacterized protein n=1 Tax=Tribonema minus TaxID=303371 RepID=A0A835Z269_9STRA|nr:hypothetical protein JKP88DRAFT_262579 [Tribonema minus]